MTRWVDETLHPHFRCSMIADRVLYENRTEHQHLIIFGNATFGRVMMLDGVVQLTTKDEFIYHEMMAHVPLFSLGAERARRVMIAGGADGGVMREVLKRKSVERVVLCEIDGTAVDICKEHLPGIGQGAFGGPFALAWAANDKAPRATPLGEIEARFKASGIATRYYTPEVHKAAFALPAYIAKLAD